MHYDKGSEKSQQKILLVYMKAVGALTINDEYRLKKLVEYEEKLKDVPKVEQLESHLANKIFEQQARKKQLEKSVLIKKLRLRLYNRNINKTCRRCVKK